MSYRSNEMNMKSLLAASVAALLVAVWAVAQQAPAQPGTPDAVDEKLPSPAAQPQESPADLAAIRATSDAFVDAFNKGDAKADRRTLD